MQRISRTERARSGRRQELTVSVRKRVEVTRLDEPDSAAAGSTPKDRARDRRVFDHYGTTVEFPAPIARPLQQAQAPCSRDFRAGNLVYFARRIRTDRAHIDKSGCRFWCFADAARAQVDRLHGCLVRHAGQHQLPLRRPVRAGRRTTPNCRTRWGRAVFGHFHISSSLYESLLA
jgi:hypothetical protein